MFTQTTLVNLMVLVTLALQVAILVGMYKRDLRREFRVFFTYTSFTLCLALVELFFLNSSGYKSKEYFLVYWLGFSVHITLMFFVIQEVYGNVLHRYEGLRTLSNMIFRWAFMLLVLLAIAAVLSSPPADRDWVYSPILKMDHGARIVEFGLIVLLFAFARTLALNLRGCAFGIAVGTCFYCSTELAVTALRNHYGNAAVVLDTFATPLFSIIALGIWTTYMYRAEREPFNIGRAVHPQLEEWNRAVLQFLNR